jgi:hypothetical protein
MWERGCFPATILEQLRRPCRPRHPYAVPRTSLLCVCTRRRDCIAQLSPSREYALRTVDFPARNSATIELTRYPHGNGSRRRIIFANSSPENQSEQMSSGVPLKADVALCRRHVSNVPISEVPDATLRRRRKQRNYSHVQSDRRGTRRVDASAMGCEAKRYSVPCRTR